MALALPFAFSCSDDDEDVATPAEDMEEELAPVEFIHYRTVVSRFCEIDSTSNGTLVYKPHVGVVLYDTQPGTYYVAAESEQEARNSFKSDFGLYDAEDYEPGPVSNEQLSLDFGEFGKITYSASDGRSEWAVVDVDLPELKDVISKIVYIPKAKWPDNYDSPFWTGDIVRGSNGWLYICVRPCDGQTGILMTWDGGTDWTYREDHYKSYYRVTNCSGDDAWDALAQFYYCNVEGFKALYSKIESASWFVGSGSSLLQAAFDNLYYHYWEHETFQVGDTWDNKYYWAGRVRNVWEAQHTYCQLTVNADWSTGMPRFPRGTQYFKRDYSVKVPDDRRAHTVYFNPQSDMSGYTRKYPIY